MEDRKMKKYTSRGVDVLDFSDRVDSLADELLGILKTMDSQALAGIRPYIEPRKNIVKIISFYDLLQSTIKEFGKVRDDLEKSQLIQRSHGEDVEIEELEKHKVLDLVTSVNKEIQSLKEFEGVRIVSKVMREMERLVDLAIGMVEQSVLASLRRLPKVVDKVDAYAKFALNHRESEKFIEAYTGICLERMGFAGIENNLASILQRTRNLTAHFNMVIDFNIRILGRKRARVTNDGLVKIMILDLKRILSDILGKADTEKKPDYIPFLIQLYARLRHSNGNIVKEIEELFVFKEEILTIMFNCFIHLIMETGLQEVPNKELREEKSVATLVETLAQFDKHGEVKRAWVEKYGSSFGVHTPEDLNSNFARKAFQFTTRLSKGLDVEERAIYTVNNIHWFKDLTTKISGYELKQLIYKNCETIVGMWKINLSGLEQGSLNAALIENLDRSRRYYLPDEERTHVVGKIRGMFQDFVAKGMFCSNPQVILEKMSAAYSGTTE